jgi:polyferredoxin
MVRKDRLQWRRKTEVEDGVEDGGVFFFFSVGPSWFLLFFPWGLFPPFFFLGPFLVGFTWSASTESTIKLPIFRIQLVRWIE